jgi:List-Bact-rpt repeat protein
MRALALLVSILASGCYSPSVTRCTVHCKEGETCPNGMACSADDHYCHAANDTEMCDAQQFALTVNRTGAGTGHIVGRDGLDCDAASCTIMATEGSYTATAVADAESRVTRWSVDGAARGDCKTADHCTFDVLGETSVDVDFGAGRNLTVSPVGRGPTTPIAAVTSSDMLIDCPIGGPSCTQGYDVGAHVTLVAKPPGFFTGWGGMCAGQTGNTCMVDMQSSGTVTANFDDYRLTLIGIPANGGTLSTFTSTGNNGPCMNGNCVVDVPPANPSVTATAIPAAGFTLNRWINSPPCENTPIPPTMCTKTLAGDDVLVAIFAEGAFVQVNTLPPPGGGAIKLEGTLNGVLIQPRVCLDAGVGSPTCKQHFDANSPVSVSFVPSATPAKLLKWNSCPNGMDETTSPCGFVINTGQHVTLTPTFQ